MKERHGFNLVCHSSQPRYARPNPPLPPFFEEGLRGIVRTLFSPACNRGYGYLCNFKRLFQTGGKGMGKTFSELRGLLKFPGFGFFTRFNGLRTSKREPTDKGRPEISKNADETGFSKG
jgi:hypothetical protein